MILTERQLDAVRKGEIVPVTVGHTECVLVRKDRFPGTSTAIYDQFVQAVAWQEP